MNTLTSLQQPYILLKPDNFQLGSQYHALQSLENVPTPTNDGKFDSKKHRELEPRRAKPQAMSRRNARERRRVKMINLGYETLRLHVPAGIENKKLSKVETLRAAVDYIKYLQNVLGNETDSTFSSDTNSQTYLADDFDTNSTEVDENRENLSEVNSPVIKVENDIVNNSCSMQNPTLTEHNIKEDKMFIDIAQWLCQNSNNLQSTIKIKGIIESANTGQF